MIEQQRDTWRSDRQAQVNRGWFPGLLLMSTRLLLLLMATNAIAQSPGNRAPNVVDQFNSLQTWADPLAVRLVDGGLDFGSPFAAFHNKHYQGIVRAQGPDGTPYLVLSRNRNPNKVCFTNIIEIDDATECSQFLPGELLVFEMTSLPTQPETQNGRGLSDGERLGSNLHQKNKEFIDTLPAESEVKFMSFDGYELPFSWHPGGMQLIDGALGVALACSCGDADDSLEFESGRTQEEICKDELSQCDGLGTNRGGILLLDFEDPTQPENLLLAKGSDMESSSNIDFSGSLAITRQGNKYLFALLGGTGHTINFYTLDTGGERLVDYLRDRKNSGNPIDVGSEFEQIGRWTDGGNEPPKEPFYRESNCSPTDFFSPQTVNPPGLPAGQPWDCFQAASFVRDYDSGELFLILGGNDTTDLFSGSDLLVLLKVNEGMLGTDINAAIEYISWRKFTSYDALPSSGDFDAAAGIYVSPSGQMLLYSAMHGADEVNDVPIVRMGEFKSLDPGYAHCGTIFHIGDGTAFNDPEYPRGVFEEVLQVCGNPVVAPCKRLPGGLFQSGQEIIIDQNESGLSGALNLVAPDFSFIRPWVTMKGGKMSLTLDNFKSHLDSFHRLGKFDAPNTGASLGNTFNDDTTGYSHCGLTDSTVKFYRDYKYEGGVLRTLYGDNRFHNVSRDPALDDDVSSVKLFWLVPEDMDAPDRSGVADTRYRWEFKRAGDNSGLTHDSKSPSASFPYDRNQGTFTASVRVFDKTLKTTVRVVGTDPITSITVKGLGAVRSSPGGIECGVTPQGPLTNCESSYPVDSNMTLTADPYPGATFVGWVACFCSDYSIPNTCPRNVGSSNNYACYAEFTTPQHSLTLDVVGQGRVSSEPAGIDCDGTGPACQFDFTVDSSVRLRVHADPGWEFTHWSGDARCQEVFVLDTDTQCVANFTPNTRSLGIAVTGTGAVSSDPVGIDCINNPFIPSNSCELEAARNSLVTLIPDPQEDFIDWSGDADCQDGVVRLSENTFCQANFETQMIDVSVTVVGKGKVTDFTGAMNCRDACTAGFQIGSIADMRAIPDRGWYFDGWSGFDCDDGAQYFLYTPLDCTATFKEGGNAFATLDFEPPGFSGSESGEGLAGQAGFFNPDPVNSLDAKVQTFAGNEQHVSASQRGGKQFAVGVVDGDGSKDVRSQRAVTFSSKLDNGCSTDADCPYAESCAPSTGQCMARQRWHVCFDVNVRHSSEIDDPPASTVIGSLSLIENTGNSSVTDIIVRGHWEDVNSVSSWRADYLAFDSAGVSSTRDCATGLQPNHWYRWCSEISLSSNKLTGCTITDIETDEDISTVFTQAYLAGGQHALSSPNEFRLFAGGDPGNAGNVMAFDNIFIAPHEPGPVPVHIFASAFEEGELYRQKSLLHRWSFSGDTRDVAGGADAILKNSAFIEDGAVHLNGVDRYVELPIQETLSSLNSVTIETWIKLNSMPTWARIFDFGNNSVVNFFATPKGWTGVLRAAITTGGNPGEQLVEGNSELPIGVETHFALSLNSFSDTVVLYVNGEPVGTTNWSLDSAALGPLTNLWLGRSQYPDPFLDGSYDEVRIYGKAMTEQEILESYEAGPDGL